MLTREQIAELDRTQAQKKLDQILRDPRVTKPLATHPELASVTDELANTIAYLEEHLSRCVMLENVAKANAVNVERAKERAKCKE